MSLPFPFSSISQHNRLGLYLLSLTKVLGDLIESSLGAFFLDCGFNLNHVWSMMLSVLDPVKNLSNLQLSPVKELIELCQSYKWDREKSVTKKDGAFCVELKVTKKGCCLTASATGRNKREGTKKAAQLMIINLKISQLQEELKRAKKQLSASR